MATLLDVLANVNPITAVIKEVIDRVVPDKAQADQAKQELDKADQNGEIQAMLGQIQVNVEEAKSTSIFVSGWRPFVGWICGSAMAYVAIVEPISRFIATVVFSYHGGFPVIDSTMTMQVLIGMLGFGGMRAFEKFKGVAAK